LTTDTGSELQRDHAGRLRHLLTLEGLSRDELSHLLDLAQFYVRVPGELPARDQSLWGRTVANLFFEPSTRTRVSFELAAKRLGADVVNLDMQSSSRVKGETVLDTIYTLQAMLVDVFVMRDAEPGLPAYVSAHVAPHDVGAHAGALAPPPAAEDRGLPALEAMGFERTNLAALGVVPGMSGGAARFEDFKPRIGDYRAARDYPAAKGPSYLSVHLRFGTVSVRELVAFAHAASLQAGGEGASTWLSELVWREFYAQILWHHPHVVAQSFKPEYDGLAFPNDGVRFTAWCEARTGYPIVDAAMRQLNATGYMHNRLRMIAASFLVKDLLVDWRWGEKVFADRLIDYDLASNNGGWQWAASTGCDAQPYFRIFNPVTQSQRFDAQGAFIRRYVPELAPLDAREIHAPWTVPPATQRAKGVVVGRDYPAPVVDHALARAQALELFGVVRRPAIR